MIENASARLTGFSVSIATPKRQKTTQLREKVQAFSLSRIVVIDQFMQPVVVDIQIQPDDSAHQYPPQRHAGTAIVFIDLRRYVLFE